MPRAGKEIALDTNILLELGAESDPAHDFRETFQGLDYRLLVPPTVIFEITWLGLHGNETQKTHASAAHQQMESWGLQPYGITKDADDLAREFSRLLRQRRLLPTDQQNDGRILAETAINEIQVLATTDKHLLDIDERELHLAFFAMDLPVVSPLHPKALLRALR